jgi:glycosyltransferase involved in cell wall biosynthesis
MSSVVYSEMGGAQEAFRLHLFRRGLLRADRVIAVSEATRRDLERLLGISGRHVRQIYSSIDPSFLEPVPEEERKRVLERYQIHYPFVLYAGSVRPQKNVPRLVEAFAVLRGDLEQHPFYRDIRLIIVGSDLAKNPEVRRAVIQSRVEQFARFLGYVPIETLRVFYQTAGVFVFPSLYEGFGLPPLEAMACGTPVVTSGVSSLPEVVGDAAEIVNPENVFDIARGMRDVLLDSKLRMQLIALGRERLKMFSWDRTAAEVLDTYREVAGVGARATSSRARR